MSPLQELERLSQAERTLRAEEEARVMRERERGWPERIRVLPPQPSFNQRIQVGGGVGQGRAEQPWFNQHIVQVGQGRRGRAPAVRPCIGATSVWAYV